MAIFAVVKYCLLLFLGLAIFLSGNAQNTPVQDDGEGMYLLSSDSGILMEQRVMRHYNPVYLHKGNTLKADSGDWSRDDIGREFFDAYGNIVITQPSGTNIYADRLHYEAETQHAILTKNVRVVDGKSVLTTNYLTYNFRDQRGTYTGGGRIISETDTITSQNAYYFERTKDSYFRNNVVVRTPDVVIYTDTMRYNSIQRETYFFGPTNIQGRAGENLYTERGTYNTASGIAKFNLNNLYTEGSKFLKGDSLYYDRSVGDGEAFRNVVFVDTLEKFYANGGYGKYRSAEESITMADKPLVKIVVSDDTSENEKPDQQPEIEEEPLSRRERRERERELRRQEELAGAEATNDASPPLRDTVALDTVTVPPLQPAVDTVYLTADTIFSRMILVKDYNPLNLNLSRDGGQLIGDEDIDYGEDDEFGDAPFDTEEDPTLTDTISNTTPASKVLTDSIQAINENIKLPDLATDSISPSSPRTVSSRPPAAQTVQKDTSSIEQTLKADSVLRQHAPMPTGSEADQLITEALTTVMKADTTSKDSVALYADTARTRIVNAYYNVRLYKSDLQAVADSAYYGMVDSMFRFMGAPMVWAEESQISADTIYMQMVNQKLDNALLKDNAFMVNAVADSTRFNQLKGRKITVFFLDNHIERLFVDGNAENLVFNEDQKTGVITDMFHDRGARIKVLFKDKKVFEYVTTKPNQYVYPLKMVTQEKEILSGFLWRPQDRPKSMEDMMHRTRDRNRDVALDQDSTDNMDLPNLGAPTPEPGSRDEQSNSPSTHPAQSAAERQEGKMPSKTEVRPDLKTDTTATGHAPIDRPLSPPQRPE